MAENFIRTKQINQSDLSGFVTNVIEANQFTVNYYGGTGININDVAQINLSGVILNIAHSIFTITGTGANIRPTLNGTGFLLSGEASAGVSGPVVFLTGNQTISGDKIFAGLITAPTGFFGVNNQLSGFMVGIGAGSFNFASGDYSFIGGGENNSAVGKRSNIGGGVNNCATANYSNVGGGSYNCATALYSNVGGGLGNCATASYSTVGGGSNNCATANYSNVGGGKYNYATANYSNVGGGVNNCATASYANIGGGTYNCATASYSNVGGGILNCATANFSNVGGGRFNCATGCFSIIGGGERNCAFGTHSYIIGGRCALVQTSHSGAAVLGDGQNRAHNSFSSHSLTLDFVSGVYFSDKKIFGFVPEINNFNINFLISGNLNSDIVLANSATQITGTIVSGNATGFNLSIIQAGAGQIQITGSGSNVIVSSYNNQFKTAGQFATISLLHTGNNRYIMYGNTI